MAKWFWLAGLLLWAGPLWGQKERKPDEVRDLLADSVETWSHRADSLAARGAPASEWQRLSARLLEQLRQHQLAIDQLVKLEKNECSYWVFHAGCPTLVIGPGLNYLPDDEVQARIFQLTIGIPINIPWISGGRRVHMDSVPTPSPPAPSPPGPPFGEYP